MEEETKDALAKAEGPAIKELNVLIDAILGKCKSAESLGVLALLGKRKDVGLHAVFGSVFPVTDFSETASVEYVSYAFDKPKYNEGECRQRGMSYAAPLKVVVRLVLWDVDKETEARSIRDVKEQEVYFGEIPLMTRNGTFIINGTERVVVSQLHRSAGVFYDHDRGKNSASGKLLYTARVIPYRGSWLDFEFDAKDIFYVRIDRRRKLHGTILLKALGYGEQELLDYFYKREEVIFAGKSVRLKIDFEHLRGQRASSDIIDPSDGKVFVKKNRRISAGAIRQMKAANIEYQEIEKEHLIGKIAAEDVVSKDGTVIVPLNSEVGAEHISEILEGGVERMAILFIDGINADHSFRNTLGSDKVTTREEALLEIYRRLRPGDPPTLEPAETLFENPFRVFQALYHTLATSFLRPRTRPMDIPKCTHEVKIW